MEVQKVKYSSDNPVLNNPYEEPKYYYDTDMNGNVDYTTVINGRRPYGYNINITPNSSSQISMFSQDDMENNDPNAIFINGIRKEVNEWRNQGYPRATRITKELLDFWFVNPRQANLRLFFCQREAVETAIWLNEIAEKDPNMGNYYLRELNIRQHSVSSDDSMVLPRTAFKMATGTGKTVVMAMLILYNYLNKRANLQDTRYADHFLICAPGITIRDRLCVLQLDNSQRSSDFERNDYYHQRGLIPRQFENELGGLNSSIVIVNYQQFLPKQFGGKHASPLDGKVVYRDGEFVKQKDTEDFSLVLSRILKGKKGKRVLVINDEAHHCYLPNSESSKRKKSKVSDTDGEDTDENESAMVWYEGLRQMRIKGYKVDHVYDLSATPYYLQGSGYEAYSLFPWVVSDFGLVDAIESGLVKIPFLPSYDNSTNELDEPKLRNIYAYIKDQLPKRGIRGQRKKDKEDNVEVTTLPAPNLPTLLNTALQQFVEDYESYAKGLREQYEAMGELFSTPPVLIVVCNNTTVSREVFRDIAGYQDGVREDGSPIYRQGKYAVFSNYDSMGAPVEKFPSLLIDSSAIDDASATIDEGFKNAYKKEIDDFKREYAIQHGSGAADNITDADILREVVNTVGKPGKLGGNIKCVVSVSMLTEGWDANTVTHVCGIRAFGSQLLCEQVVGRALRRQSYDMVPYDKAGREIDRNKISHYNPENIIYKFPPEYARVIGVPFNTFKGGATTVTPPQRPKYFLKALPERSNLEIKFPNITGYRSENIEGKLVADFTNLPKFRLDFRKIPTETVLQTIVNGDKKMLSSDCLALRDQQVIYYFSHLMIRMYYSSKENGQQFQKFPDIKKIVEQWYDEQLEIDGGNNQPEQKRLVMLWDYESVLASINAGIRQANKDKEIITGVLNYYNPEGSSRYVYRPTSKNVLPTVKSHVNYIIAEENSSWAQVKDILEKMDGVESYVKNTYLSFRVPYSVADERHDYQPDLILKVKGKSGEITNLILELSDFDNDRKGNKEYKRDALVNFWIPAANNIEKYGKWDLLEVNDVDKLEESLIKKIESL